MRRAGWRWLGVPKPHCAQLGAPKEGSRALSFVRSAGLVGSGRRGGAGAFGHAHFCRYAGLCWSGPGGAPPLRGLLVCSLCGVALACRGVPAVVVRLLGSARLVSGSGRLFLSWRFRPGRSARRPRRGGRHLAPCSFGGARLVFGGARTPPPRSRRPLLFL